MDAVLYQKGENQTVVEIGGAYDPIEKLTLHAGYNHGRNPIPDYYLDALFPAIVLNHLTFGAGYRFTQSLSGDFSLAYALTSGATNPGNGSTIPPVESSHGQLNWQLMPSYLF